MANLRVQGVDALRRRMEGVSKKLIKSAITKGLRKGANIVRDQARANFDGATGPSAITGALRASIRVKSRRGSPTRVAFSVFAGDLTKTQTKKFGMDAVFYAFWVEKGHINRKAGQALRGSREAVRAARAASTSNTPAHPFMRPAIQAKAQEAIAVVATAINQNLPGAVQ